MMEQAVAVLPFVTEARRDEARPYVLHVTTTEGLRIPYALIAPGRKIVHDPHSVLQSVQESLEQFQREINGVTS